MPPRADSPSYLPGDAAFSRKDYFAAANDLRKKSNSRSILETTELSDNNSGTQCAIDSLEAIEPLGVEALVDIEVHHHIADHVIGL